MNSGWPDDNFDESSQQELDQLTGKKWIQRDFAVAPALVGRSHDGVRIAREYTAGELSPEEGEVVKDGWDHEHCYICRFKIGLGFTFWQNEDGIIICDQCHTHALGGGRESAG